MTARGGRTNLGGGREIAWRPHVAVLWEKTPRLQRFHYPITGVINEAAYSLPLRQGGVGASDEGTSVRDNIVPGIVYENLVNIWRLGRRGDPIGPR